MEVFVFSHEIVLLSWKLNNLASGLASLHSHPAASMLRAHLRPGDGAVSGRTSSVTTTSSFRSTLPCTTGLLLFSAVCDDFCCSLTITNIRTARAPDVCPRILLPWSRSFSELLPGAVLAKALLLGLNDWILILWMLDCRVWKGRYRIG